MSNFADGIGSAITFLFVVVCVSVPFAIWKLIDIVIWLWRHVGIVIK
jgi:hypothetical protein